MSSNMAYLKTKPKQKKTTHIDPRKMCDGFLETKPVGVFAMTWDKEGIVTFYSTHGKNKKHFVRSNLMYFINENI